MVNYKR